MLASSRGRAAPHHSPQGNGRTMCAPTGLGNEKHLRQHRTIPALRLKHRSGSCGTAAALPKCSIMSGCGTRIVLRGQKPLALCDRCPCFGSLFPPLAALTFAASSIICAFGLASAAPRSPYRHLELCGIAFNWLRIKRVTVVWCPRRCILTRSAAPARSILARAANLFYSHRRGRCTDIILYSLLFIISFLIEK